MLNSILLLLAPLVSNAQEDWANSIIPYSGYSYIQVAEELANEPVVSAANRTLITELYVLAAVADPTLRDSAIIGVISTVTDEELKLQLQNLRSNIPLLVPSVVNTQNSSYIHNDEAIETICDVLSSLRQGKTLTTEQTFILRPWAYLFPNSFDLIFQGTQRRRRPMTVADVDSTLKVELAVLGGSSLWSADLATTGGTPVIVSMSDDFATLLSVDPTKRIRKDGMWVTE